MCLTSKVPRLSVPSTFISILVPVPAPVFAPFPSSFSFPSPPPSLFPSPFLPPLFSPRYHIVGHAPGRAPEGAGYLQAPPPVYRDDAACAMAVPGLLLCFFPDVADTRDIDISSLSPPFLSILVPVPISAPVPAPAPLPAPVPVSATALVVVPAPVPSCFRPLVSSPVPTPSPFPTPTRSWPRSLLPVPRTWLLPRYNARAQTSGLANGAVECPQAPLPACRDDDLDVMKGPVLKQKRIAAEDVLLPFPPPHAGTR